MDKLRNVILDELRGGHSGFNKGMSLNKLR